MTKSIRAVLEELARHSHQAKGTDSYYPLVEKSLKELSEIVLGEKKGMLSREDFNTMSDEAYALKQERNIGFNLALDHIAKLILRG